MTRFDATDRRPVGKWTAASRLTTSPQGQPQQQKRSIHMVHKPANSECSRHEIRFRASKQNCAPCTAPHPPAPALHARAVADTSPRYSRDRAGATRRWKLNNIPEKGSPPGQRADHGQEFTQVRRSGRQNSALTPSTLLSLILGKARSNDFQEVPPPPIGRRQEGLASLRVVDRRADSVHHPPRGPPPNAGPVEHRVARMRRRFMASACPPFSSAARATQAVAATGNAGYHPLTTARWGPVDSF